MTHEEISIKIAQKIVENCGAAKLTPAQKSVFLTKIPDFIEHIVQANIMAKNAIDEMFQFGAPHELWSTVLRHLELSINIESASEGKELTP